MTLRGGALHAQPWGNVDDGKIHKVDTVPPPAGESDAYNAPTRVGVISSDAWAELIEAAQRRDAEDAAKAKSAGLPATPAPAATRLPAEASAVPPTLEELPRLSSDDDDDAAWIDENLASEQIARSIAASISQPAAAPIEPPAPLSTAQPTPASTAPPIPASTAQPAAAPRASLFPEWVAGTNINEVEAREAARRQKIRTTLRVGIALALVLALGTWAVLR
ncbi:MAG: hypothetical protein BGO98_32670 [Myxococcales bacterium 68-20]|nr:hypothetical protein [Myxococcales bacterium]OJY18489.1 MAG: hypothetical protein BGO98_32670 [Myxococcales bacterium 68-20]